MSTTNQVPEGAKGCGLLRPYEHFNLKDTGDIEKIIEWETIGKEC